MMPAEVTSPARQKGEIIMFNDRILWFYKPGLRKPVSISPAKNSWGKPPMVTLHRPNIFDTPVRLWGGISG